ncbi:MAG TPA: haloalkane dehalogenase [Burkholderiales bacterium]|jgi:pimeloyl-ACP methyl ester carboxylesterase|nr:haloalkane dehalogenase [Burkholderiales bacterium]
MRTPDERFANLPGFSWAPNYLEWKGLRIHYLDVGKGDRVLLALHGEPTWSYLYRKMIPPFVAAGYRVVAPDFVGFGRSDKPEDEGFYTFEMHREFLLDLLEKLDLKRVTLAVQDWGGLLGLTLPMEMPERIERLLVMNTALGTGDVPLSEGFVAWRAYVAKTPSLDCGKLLARACPHLSAAEAAAYEAPYPDAASKAGVRRFPALVPDNPEAPGAAVSRRARDWLQTSWKGDTFMAVGAKDPVLGPPVMNALRKIIRGCPEPWLHAEGGHFLQEWGDDVAKEAIARWR